MRATPLCLVFSNPANGARAELDRVLGDSNVPSNDFKSRSLLATMLLYRGGNDFNSILAVASDGESYEFEVSPRDLVAYRSFSRSAGAELYRAFSLPVMQWAPLVIGKWLMDNGLERLNQGHTGCSIASDGMYCAFRTVADPDGRRFPSLPQSMDCRLANRTDFWRAWLIDACANSRQQLSATFWVVCTKPVVAYFSIRSNMFEETGSEVNFDVRRTRLSAPAIYGQLSRQAATDLLEGFQRFNEAGFWKQIAALPPSWLDDESLSQLHTTVSRIKDKPTLRNLLDAMISEIRLTQQQPLDQAASVSVRSLSVVPASIPRQFVIPCGSGAHLRTWVCA